MKEKKKALQRLSLPPKLPAEKEGVSESDSDIDGGKKRK